MKIPNLHAARTFAPALLLALASAGSVLHAADADACKLLSASAIFKATTITVGAATAGRAVPGVLGRCTWEGGGDNVIVTLADTHHMETTIAAQESLGTRVQGIGSKAVATERAAFTGGGYIVSVLDAKGGFGVSVLGKAGTLERVTALARLVECRR